MADQFPETLRTKRKGITFIELILCVPGILLGILYLFLFNLLLINISFKAIYVLPKKTVSCKIVYQFSEKLSSIETFHKFHSLFLLLLTSYTSVIHVLQIKVLKTLKTLKSLVIISTDEKPRLREIVSQKYVTKYFSPSFIQEQIF